MYVTRTKRDMSRLNMTNEESAVYTYHHHILFFYREQDRYRHWCHVEVFFCGLEKQTTSNPTYASTFAICIQLYNTMDNNQV